MRFLPLPFLAIFALALITSNAQPSFAEEVISSGQFEGRSRHVTTGGVTIKKTAKGAIVILEKDFVLDGAPDPKVGFGNNGKYDIASQLSVLKSKTGRQEYAIPASVDPSRYNEIYIWCEKFSVPLGVAKLK